MGRVCFTGVLLLLFGCSEETAPPPVGPDPLPFAGPYRVGHRTFDVTYDPPGLDEPGLDAPRTITVHLWYPTEDLEGPPTTYASLVRDTDVFEDAELAVLDSYPVHVYSHGHRGFAGTSHDLMRHFASHGWVAVAPDHTNHTLSDFVDPVDTWLRYVRSLDLTEALDALEALPADDPLSGRLSTERVLVSGHSFGAGTVWASAGASFDTDRIQMRCDAGEIEAGCTQADLDAFAAGVGDPRVAAAMPMAGSYNADWHGDTGYTTASVPFLTMSGTLDPVGADGQYARVDNLDITWIEIEGGCHQAFALGGCDEISDEDAFGIVNRYALAFARVHVLGETEPSLLAILDGSEALSERVTFQRKSP